MITPETSSLPASATPRIINWQIRKSSLKRYYRESDSDYLRCRLCHRIISHIGLKCPVHGHLTKKHNRGCRGMEYKRTLDWVRLRDNNTCQWFDCGSTEDVQVHHIFPASEYPDLVLVTEYMICYCGKHHKLWHEAREEYTEKLIKMLKSYNRL